MSNNQGDAATPARAQQPEETQTPGAEQNAQGTQPATSQHPTGNVADAIAESPAEAESSTGTQPADNPQVGGAHEQAQTQAPSPVGSAATATPQPTGDPSEGVADSAEITGGASPQADDNQRAQTQPKPDVSDQDWQELAPKLLGLFNNNREQLARALGLHRSTVDRWLNGKSRPNTSTILRMRRLAQERRVE